MNIQSEFEPLPILPGIPVIDIDVKEQGQKWSKIHAALQKDGLESDFIGVIMNGRVRSMPFDQENVYSNYAM